MATLLGYVAALVAVLFFGSNLAVLAKFETGDGMFFQWVYCCGIWCTGLVVQIMRGDPTFYSTAMIGGWMWCTGNCLTCFIVKRIGLGPGLVTWGTSGLVIGWFVGFFGLPGVHKSERHDIKNVPLNVAGVLVAFAALIDSALVKRGKPLSCEPGASTELAVVDMAERLSESDLNDPNRVVGDVESPAAKIKGIIAAMFAGCCYGTNFLPSSQIQEFVIGASQNGLDYVFNQFCGIFAGSTVYFLVYCAYKGNRPWVNQQIVLPGFVSGAMWGVAQSAWFVANVDMGYAAAFPIILIGPGFVGSLWSVFFFKDIYGQRNFVLLFSYFVLAGISCALIVLSKM